MASLPGNPSHMSEGFVQPSSYLRPRGKSQPMPHAGPESAIERDQRIGLVCVGPKLPPRYGLTCASPLRPPIQTYTPAYDTWMPAAMHELMLIIQLRSNA